MSAILAMLSRFYPAGRLTHSTFSWRYCVPGLMVGFAALLTVDYVLGLHVRKQTLRSLESMAGAPVTTDTGRTYLVSNQLLLGGVRLASPDRPSEQLAEAEYCQIDFDGSPLLQRQLAVAACSVTGLKVDPAAFKPTNAAVTFRDSSNDLAAGWLAQVESRLHQDLVVELPSVQAAAALAERMSAQREKHDLVLQQLERQATKLQRAAKDAAANPLRYADVQRDTQFKRTALRGQFDELNQGIASLSGTLESERRSIVAGRAQDEAQLRQRLALQPIDAAACNAYLLRDEAAGPIGELICWFRQIREIASPAATNAVAEHRDVLIRALHLQGTTSLAGQPIEFRGTISNLSSTSTRQVEPIRLRFVTASPQPMELLATLDRRGQQSRDELIVKCPQWKIPELTLGRADQLTLTVAPADGKLSVSLRAVGEALTGEVFLEHSNTRITPRVHGGLNVLPLVSVGEANNFSTRVAVQGTLQAPRCKLESSLSPALAKALEESLQAATTTRLHEILAAGRQRVDERLAELERQVAHDQKALVARLQTVTSDVERMADSQMPRDRISFERLGHRLPETSRFR